MNKWLTFPDSLRENELLNTLSETYSIEKEPSSSALINFFDTFDWRLFRENVTLIHERDTFRLLAIPSRAQIAISPSPSQNRQSYFWWSFPEGALQAALQKKLDIRAVFSRGKIQWTVQTVRILNRDDKAVSFVDIEEYGFPRKREQKFSFIHLSAVRGYGDEANEIFGRLKTAGVEAESSDRWFFSCMQLQGQTPGDYSSRVKLALEPDMAGEVAAKKILQKLLQVIRDNERGIREDIDTEFLHDFRVAIRRTRSALSQIKGVFQKTAKERFRKDFAYLGKMTNRLRDLDVYLLQENTYKQMLPDHLKPGLDPLFEAMRKERQQEHAKLVKTLNSKSYERILDVWQKFLKTSQKGERSTARFAETPVIEIAKKRIGKKLGQVLTRGKRIDETSPDSELHDLRIDCKKLRYLLEFFISLFPEKEMTRFIKQLKRLQNNLGDFNDMSVQQAELNRYLSTLDAETEAETIAAIGGLVTILNQEQRSLRKKFHKTFANFSCPRNVKLAHSLFEV